MIKTFLSIILSAKTSLKFSVGVVLGLAFSIAVILGTFGIMDGFEASMKKSLRGSQGDLYLYSEKSTFIIDENLKRALKGPEINLYSATYQTQGFLLKGEQSKGVLIRGIEPDSFSKVTKLKISLNEDGCAIGSELSKKLGVKKGDYITLAFGNNNRGRLGVPELQRFRVDDIVSHGIYEKDLRSVYLSLKALQNSYLVSDRVNLILISAKNPSDESLLNLRRTLLNELGLEYNIRLYWQEFSSLIEAVKVEKFMIGLILQMVVVIAIFNVLAFIIFLNEQKSRELFLLKALGFSQKMVARSWFMLVMIIWSLSCFFSLFLIRLLKWALVNISFLQLPPEVYHLTNLEIILDSKDYVIVFSLALLWLMVFSGVLLHRLKKRPILEGLRREFA